MLGITVHEAASAPALRASMSAQTMFIRVSLGIGVLLALAIALIPEVPDKLPGVALGSASLLQLERGLAALAGFLLLLLVFVRGWAGELPDEISGRGVTYKARELQDGTKEALAALTEEAKKQREAIVRLEARVDLLDGGAYAEEE